VYLADAPVATDRLLLRPFVAADLDAVVDLQSRLDVVRQLYDEPLDRAGAQGYLDRRIARVRLAEEGDGLNLAVERRDDGTFVGHVNLHYVSAVHRVGEVGYVVHPDHRGLGYATEALRPLLAIGFDHLGLHRMIGRLDARNTASARVLEKLGMRREAHHVENEWVKGEWTDELVYAVLDREWLASEGRT
jgi:RimJ/RimL family protein N-acetyltransferase